MQTEKGRFMITRGVLDVPDEVGEAHGWERVDTDEDAQGPSAPVSFFEDPAKNFARR